MSAFFMSTVHCKLSQWLGLGLTQDVKGAEHEVLGILLWSFLLHLCQIQKVDAEVSTHTLRKSLKIHYRDREWILRGTRCKRKP